MAEYTKKTVAELQEILRSRNLPSSGKKAELVARLNENDKQAAGKSQSTLAHYALFISAPPAAPEHDLSAEPESVQPAAEEPIPTTEPIQSAPEASTDPTSTAEPVSEPVVDKPSPDTALADQTNYSLNLPTSTVDDEIAKRKARAERFGTSNTAASQPAADDLPTEEAPSATTTSDADAAALRNLERAKRFGTGSTAIGKLDEALPSEIARGSRKRGHAQVATEASELDDPGLKRSFANRGRGGRGGRFGGKPPRGGTTRGVSAGPGAAVKPQGVQKTTGPAFTSDKDRLAAEARKKKFATA